MSDKKPILDTDERFPDAWKFLLCGLLIVAVIMIPVGLSMWWHMNGSWLAKWLAGG